VRHFVAYHNINRMGRALHEGEPLRLLTDKPVRPLLHNTVWVVVGEGDSPKRYSLGSVFVVNDVGETREDGFGHYATGPGHVFEPPPELNGLEWFPDFFRGVAHFSLGVQEVKELRFIESLVGLANTAGYRPA
jgi:hypothetical protein